MFRLVRGYILVALLNIPTLIQADESPSYLGRVEALNRVEVSARVEGVVIAIHFQPGQRVTEGDLLMSFDTVETSQRLRAAQAIEQKAAALLEDAKQVYERNKALRERGTIADAMYFKSKAAVSIAAAVMAEAKSRLEAAQIELDFAEVRAPISGIVSPPLVSRGSFVETGRKGVLATIVQLDPVRIVYDIPYPNRLMELGITNMNTIETYADTVDLMVELAPDWIHPELAEPSHLSADVSPDTHTITAWAIVANPTHTLRPGMEVRVRPIASETTSRDTVNSD